MEKDIEFLHEMFPLERDIICETYLSSNKDIDETISSLIILSEKTPRFPPTYEEAISNGGAACSSSTSNSEMTKKRKDSRRNLGKKEWKLPILGRLSDDFLKVPNEVLNNSANTGYHCKGCAKLKQKENIDEPCASYAGSTSSSIIGSNMGDIDSIIRRRMEDNVSQTRSATMGMNCNSDNIQYLDDERLALMLQNQEFRNVVKSDPEFQQALKDDCNKQEYENPIDIWQERDESVVFRPQDFQLDYGYERSDIVDPDGIWPDHPTTSPSHDVTKMVKALGKASRKRLGSIAKRFASIRRTKSSRNYGDVDSFAEFDTPIRRASWDTESTQNLILTDADSVSCIGHRDRHPMSVISERSS